MPAPRVVIVTARCRLSGPGYLRICGQLLCGRLLHPFIVSCCQVTGSVLCKFECRWLLHVVQTGLGIELLDRVHVHIPGQVSRQAPSYCMAGLR